MNDLRDLYQETIFDHYRRPRNFHAMDDATHYAEGFNPLCGDRLTLFVQVEDGVVRDASFQGAGCAISMASASLMTEQIKGKPIGEVETLFGHFHDLVTGKNEASDMGKLQALSGVREFPTRVKCATLAWHALHAALQHKAETVSTE